MTIIQHDPNPFFRYYAANALCAYASMLTNGPMQHSVQWTLEGGQQIQLHPVDINEARKNLVNRQDIKDRIWVTLRYKI